MNLHSKGTPTLTTNPESAQTILTSVDQLDAWCWIMGFRVQLGEYFKNPFRADSNAGCWLYEAPNGLILLADFASPEHNQMNFLHALKYIYPTLNFYQQLKKFRVEYIESHNIPLNEQYKRKYNSNFDFKLRSVPRKWIKEDAMFWLQYDIHRRQLESEDVLPVREYYKNSRYHPEQMIKHIPLDPTYSIHINSREKLYRPYNKEQKWISNLTSKDIGGKKKCTSNVLWLTKAYKDYQVVVNERRDSRFTLNEGTPLPDIFVEKAVAEFDLIIPLMDNDPAGRAAAKLYEQQIKDAGGKAYGATLPLHYLKDNITDPSDLIAKINKQQLNYELDQIMEEAHMAVSTHTL